MSTTSTQGIYAVSITLPLLATAVVALRFRARSLQKADVLFDDWAQLPALVLYITMAIIAIVGAAKGAFGHPAPITNPPDSAPSVFLAERLWFALQIIQIPALMLIKLAALRFYRRVFCPGAYGTLYVAHWILIGFVTLWAIAMITFYVASCGSSPSAAYSNHVDFIHYCRRTEAFEVTWAVTDFSFDTFVLLLPLPSIWKLHASVSRKVGISAIFLIALVAYGASIARLVIFVGLTEKSLGKAPPDTQTQDTQATWFSMLEIGFSIIALNMPSLWIFMAGVSVDSILRSARSVFSLRTPVSGADVSSPTEAATANNTWATKKSSAGDSDAVSA